MIRTPFSKHYKTYLSQYHLDNIDTKELLILTFKRGEYLFHEGEYISYLYIVIDGKSKVTYTMENGKSILFAFYSQYGLLGDVEFSLGNTPAYNTVQALTDFTCIGIPVDLYTSQLWNNLLFMQDITKGLAQKLNQCNRNDALLILSPVEERLCSYLFMAQINGYFNEPLTETSELLGTSYRHLLRTLESLCKQNVLEREKKGFYIKDLSYLKKHANNCYHI